MSEILITNDVIDKINAMGEMYVYNDADFITQGEPQSNVSNADLSQQLGNYVSKFGDSMIGNLACPTVLVNSIQFSDNTVQSSAVSNTDLNDVKTATQQISYNDQTATTNISNLTAGNFNTFFLSDMTENIQNSLNTLKAKTTGITYNNSITNISNLNATTLTAGNFNTSHLSGTISNIQEQINSLKTNVVNDVTYFNKPIVMSSNTGADRAITSSYYNFNSLINNSSIGQIYSNSLDMIYVNNVTLGSHTFKTQAGGTESTTLVVKANGIGMSEGLTMSSSSVGKRKINTSTVNVLDDTNGSFVVGSINSNSNNVLYNSLSSGNSHSFTLQRGGISSTALTISDNISSANPIVMSGSTTASRTITNTNYKITNETNAEKGYIYSSFNDINYNVNSSNGNHYFFIDNNNKFTIGNDYNYSSKPLILSATAFNDRLVGASTYQIADRNSAFNTFASIESATNNIDVDYKNTSYAGSHNFYADTTQGTTYKVLTINSNGLIMNQNANFLQFPDNTRQFSASNGYTKFYTPSDASFSGATPSAGLNLTVTIPNLCYRIDMSVISGGGKAGAINGAFGGSGGGGMNVRSSSGILVSPGQTFNIVFASVAGGAYWEGEGGGMIVSSTEIGTKSYTIKSNGVDTPYSNVLVGLLNGLNGSNATGSANPGAGANAGSANPTTDTTAVLWALNGLGRTTAGLPGLTNGAPAKAGSPSGTVWVEGGYGMGRLSASVARVTGTGVVIITYYISN